MVRALICPFSVLYTNHLHKCLLFFKCFLIHNPLYDFYNELFFCVACFVSFDAKNNRTDTHDSYDAPKKGKRVNIVLYLFSNLFHSVKTAKMTLTIMDEFLWL